MAKAITEDNASILLTFWWPIKLIKKNLSEKKTYLIKQKMPKG